MLNFYGGEWPKDRRGPQHIEQEHTSYVSLTILTPLGFGQV